ncbi:winged helix DNA-binding domain-containing protein [Cohnella sp. AR92]|uniref:winged helix DNA-binding domain-containing protein n=1 Tax=Cohnella sp. AR92 TaxID=648716 RepID=UPI000F8C4905|nr:winged helix DNA-binding domain-containing protein [Cohnella sp. AR92]RUS45237.1 winged helix DNA-binding domain-containing protein [Cohnella sp. AR92]
MQPTGTLKSRALNRAMLARQMLLCRVKLPVLDVLEKVIGLQAQSPNAPYFALWSRMEDFKQEQLSQLILDRKAVRMALMRSTLHLVSSSDALQLRPWLQSVLERSLNGSFGKQLNGVDRMQLVALGRKLLAEKPMTSSELGLRLQEHWPDCHPEAVAAAVRNLVPLVQVPPRGIWGESGQATHTSADIWLGRPLDPMPNGENLIRRYLAAFGPASVRDIQAWSGLTGLRSIIDKLRPELVAFRDEAGTELFDLPDAPRPDADTPAEPRLLGEFDNILLSYADRSRVMDANCRSRVFTVNGIIRPTILIDGYVAGTWSLKRERGRTVLDVAAFVKLSPEEKEALHREGSRLLRFAAAETLTQEVVIHSP